jgi:hypothetical protein
MRRKSWRNDCPSTSFSGFGTVVTGTDYSLDRLTPVATGALAATLPNLEAPAGTLVQLVSNAPVPTDNVQLSGGQITSRAGFVFNGAAGISGFGMVDGP